MCIEIFLMSNMKVDINTGAWEYFQNIVSVSCFDAVTRSPVRENQSLNICELVAVGVGCSGGVGDDGGDGCVSMITRW